MSDKKNTGRPKLYDKEKIEEIKILLEDYIERMKVPVVADFAYRYKLSRQSLYDYPEFSTLLKRLIDKKESALELAALDNEINVPMAIFALKQLGWRDKQDIDMTTGGDKIPQINLIVYDKYGEK